MSKIKFVFVCPDIRFLSLQYKDFELCNRDLIKIGNSRRFAKISSFLKIVDWSNLKALSNRIYKSIFSEIQEKDIEYCFILYARVYEAFDKSICEYIRNTYRKSKVVIYFGDLVCKHRLLIDRVKENFDMIFTFDKGDADKYNLKWLSEPFSSSIVDMDFLKETNNSIKWDITFVGHAKNRYEKIIRMYEILTEKGLRCDFHIIGVPRNQRKYQDVIGYKPLEFTELLKHVVSSKCVAEIVQDNGTSPTTRYSEAMLFGRNLITDCKAFQDQNNRPQNVFYYENTNEVGEMDIEKLVTKIDFDRNKYISEFSVDTMIKNIASELHQEFFHTEDTISA